MSVGELIGLLLTAALLGGGVGVAIVAALARTRSARAHHGEKITDVCAQWLAAQWTMSRASMSFVAAFQALAAEDSESPNYGLREQEGQRARAQWSAAMDGLDRAEAALVMVELRRGGVRRFPTERIDADELRAAIHGDATGVQTLRARLRADDLRAVEWVQQLLAEDANRKSKPRAIAEGLIAWTGQIVDRHAQR